MSKTAEQLIAESDIKNTEGLKQITNRPLFPPSYYNCCLDDNDPIHWWFGLSYSSYLVLPRSILQSAPVEWQKNFVKCLEELQTMFEQENDHYIVSLRDENGKFTKDPYCDYQRGRRKIEIINPPPESE